MGGHLGHEILSYLEQQSVRTLQCPAWVEGLKGGPSVTIASDVMILKHPKCRKNHHPDHSLLACNKSSHRKSTTVAKNIKEQSLMAWFSLPLDLKALPSLLGMDQTNSVLKRDTLCCNSNNIVVSLCLKFWLQ